MGLPLIQVTIPRYSYVAIFNTDYGTPPHFWRYISDYVYFNWLVSVALSSAGRENLKPSDTREKTL